MEKYGLHLNLKFRVIGPSRRRRGADDFVPEVELNLNLSGEMNSNEDLSTVGQSAASEINTQVVTSVAEGGDGEFIDETQVPETQDLDFCSIEASTTFCEADRVGVMVPICAMPEDAEPYLGTDKSCTGSVSGDYLVFEASSDCPLERTVNGTHSTHTGSVNWVDGHRGAVISRQRVVKVSSFIILANCFELPFQVDFVCVFQTSYTLSTDGFTPLVSQTEVDLGSEQGVIDITIGLYDGPDFTQQLPADAEIDVPDNLYIAAVMQESGDLVTTLENCWATPR